MPHADASRVTAVLGPTNTGKTHLAVERMAAHSSGMIGFPLRLLAREVYDRVVAMKGPREVALITGEERIVPPGARWFLCTAESMPVDKDVAFCALDEAQLGADPERGHVFTDRLLHARGREETMILGADTLRPVLRKLVPQAEVIERPRFSTLSYAGAKKISRLPRRAAIVAFSAEEVYAVAEMLRRLRGGAAVVMGALSPRTRNAQVAMFQAGEVDYLVATDAIGMGLNMDVSHVAFAGLHKFDGHRRRRLTVAEMAQIAGRAGRHQRDGMFGAIVEEGPDAFLPEEVLAIEEHRFAPLDRLYWRDGDPDRSSIDALIAALERRPDPDLPLAAAPPAIDLLVLKRLADEGWVRERVRSPAMVARLWAACGVPDFGKAGVDNHARFVARLFGHLADGAIPHRWFADEVARLDRVDGDVETIAGRLAGIRTWAYIAQRADWLADPRPWAERTAAVEERLSDALHAGLTQRFVDKRTTMLMRQLGSGAAHLPVVIGPQGEVMVEEHELGRLAGFAFTVSPDARAGDKRLLLAAAEKRLAGERARRGGALAEAGDEEIELSPLPQAGGTGGGLAIAAEQDIATGRPPLPPPASGRGIIWQGHSVAHLTPGPTLARPRVTLDRSLAPLDRSLRDRIQARLDRWLAEALARAAAPLVRFADLARAADAGPGLRSIAGALEAGAGLAPRRPHAEMLAALSPEQRKRLRAAGVTIGALDLFAPALLKPAAQGWRARLLALRDTAPALPPPGATVLPRGAAGAVPAMGYRPLGPQAVRVDLAERLARAAHDARAGRKPFVVDAALATSMGLQPATLARLMAELGFRARGEGWVWQGRPPTKRVAAKPGGAFAALAELGLE